MAIILESKFAMMVAWGKELTHFYNDAYRPILGASKHPSLGVPVPEVFPEIWDTIGPLFNQVMRGEAVGFEDLLVPLDRHGFLEECYFTFSYSPIRDESSAVGGLLVTVAETTGRVVNERRLRTLRDLAALTSGVTDEAQLWRLAARALEGNTFDVPYSLLLARGEQGPRLVAWSGFAQAPPPSAAVEVISARIGEQGGAASAVELDGSALGTMPKGSWPTMPTKLVALPVSRPGQPQPFAHLVIGLSPRRSFDDEYRSFVGLLADQLATAVSHARAFEDEKRRAEELSALDQAKTSFFSNVSHEFRTPLTLMLGPLEQLLAGPATSAEQRAQLTLVQANALRLLKLVNTLLAFARHEAGRQTTTKVPTDVAALTRAAASAFETVVERAGLKLRVDCPPLQHPAWVDRDMWERIVLNLLSNAFKFTFEGEIRVALRQSGERLSLTVQDTGIGIPEDELPRVFDRFHRVRNARARVHEGTGIGLSLVREMAEQHEGTVSVQSTVGRGTTFTVEIPLRTDQAAASVEPLAPLSANARAFQLEAALGLEDLRPPPAAASGETTRSGRILLADDNADMRQHVTALLGQRFEVEVVSDGLRALEVALARPPDAIVSDVMMPGLDGLELVRRLRADERTARVPVALLSARAEQEAAVEALAAGADDYVLKPFGAKELLARVDSLVKAGKAAAERDRLLKEVEVANDRLRRLFETAPAIMCSLAGPDHVYELANAPYLELVGRGQEIIGRKIVDALPELEGQGFTALLDEVYRSGEPFVGREVPVRLDRRRDGVLQDAFVTFVYQPARGADGAVRGIDVFGFDVTELVLSRQSAETLAATLRERAEFEQQLIGIVSHDLRNPLAAILLGTASLARHATQPERVTVAASRIRGSAERATRMIRDLLDFSQARLGGGIQLKSEPTNLEKLTTAVAEEVRATYPERTVQVSALGNTDGVWDADRLSQVVENLLSNALKYSPAGSAVQVRVAGDGDEVELAVSNAGQPIPAEKLKLIFRPFQRATAELDTASRSVGLGLYIVRHLVEAHRGSISVESSAEQGTRFSVRLPRS